MKPMEPMQGMEPMEPMKPMEKMSAEKAWWPAGLGEPSSTGSQNERRYAWFADAKRLAVDSGGKVEVYDTGSHRIQGFAQGQGGSPSLRFSVAGDKTIGLDSLTPA